MARLRYVKTLDEVRKSAEQNPEFLNSTVRSVRVVYLTAAPLPSAILPPPLLPLGQPEVALTVSTVSIHISPEFSIEIGSGVFGIPCTYEGVRGTYLITMPMTTEAAVLSGRDTFGEPKKTADIKFEKDGSQVSASIARMGIPYIEVSGTVHENLGPRDFTEYAYCFKTQPSCEKPMAFDHDPLLVRLEWRHKQSLHARVTGEVKLNESPFDPVIDIPVREIIRMEYEEGNTQSSGSVLRSVPGEALLPFLHQRYDDPTAQGIEL